MLRQGLSQINTGLSYHTPPMSPTPLSPVAKLAQPQRTSSTDSTVDGIRKRVCKACDRCRLKKSKCDGSHPCSRCKADNAICVFGERKKSHDKVYPKGYVEMLEQQQAQLVAGLQEMYTRLSSGQPWEGPALSEANGHPLTHDILAALNLLETKHDGSEEHESFEEDCQKLQSKLLADGAGYMHRRGSLSSDSEHSQQGHGRLTPQSTPTLAKPPVFKENFSFSASPSPLAQSPMPRQRQSYPPAQQSPLHQSSPLTNDPQLYQTEWSIPDLSNPEVMMRSKYAMQTPQLQQNLDEVADIMENTQWEDSFGTYDLGMNGITSYPQQFGNLQGLQDLGGSLDPMDLEFNKFIQVVT